MKSGPGEQQYAAPLGRTSAEDEAGHLRRVAEELGGANSTTLGILSVRLGSSNPAERLQAAAALGALGDRHAIALLRGLLEGDSTDDWEVAAHGLRQSRDRSGWLCLESVALDHVHSLGKTATEPRHAFRLLVMGRTKTMDRLFRAIDGHSRSISREAARNFSKIAVRSVPGEMSRVMALRLGITEGAEGRPSTPEQVSGLTGLSLDLVRRLESEAWETVQRPRPYHEIRLNYEVNND